MKNQANTINLSVLCLAAVLGAAGCASRNPAPVVERGGQPAVVSETASSSRDLYTVKKGDTVRSIARAHGIDFRELIAWNSIENPNSIVPGIVLRIRQSGASMASAGSAYGTEVAMSRPVIGAPIVESRLLENSPASANSTSSATTLGNSHTGNTATLKREPKGGKDVYSEAALAQAQAQGQPKAAESPPAQLAAIKPEAKSDVKSEPAAAPASTPAAATGDEDVAWIWPNNGKIIGTFSEGASKGVDIAGKAGDPVLAAGEGKVVYSGTGLRGYGKLVIVKHNNTYLSAYAHNQNVLVKEGQSVGRGQKIAEMGNTDADQVKLHFEVRRQGKPVDPLKYLPPR
jgi:lipoprotein NlpD